MPTPLKPSLASTTCRQVLSAPLHVLLILMQLGHYKARVPFGCFLRASTPLLKNVDGVAGFGIPKVGANGEKLPMPLLWALTDPRNVESNARGLKRRYTFFASKDHGEVQLGGYDTQSVEGGVMKYFKSLSSGEFVLGVSSIRLGTSPENAVEVLRFRDEDDKAMDEAGGEDVVQAEDNKRNVIPAVLDTGQGGRASSCH